MLSVQSKYLVTESQTLINVHEVRGRNRWPAAIASSLVRLWYGVQADGVFLQECKQVKARWRGGEWDARWVLMTIICL